MLLEVTVHRSRAEVRNALFQFVARRGLEHQRGWLSDDQVQVRAPGENGSPDRELRVGISRKRGATVAQIETATDQASVDLAYTLCVYLESDAAYSPEVPSNCPNCARLIRRARANFCAGCGTALTAEGRDRMAVAALDAADEPQAPLDPGDGGLPSE
ncbi:MAG: hypothetical protein V3T70_06310 [Phycisphaerae bacterium]